MSNNLLYHILTSNDPSYIVMADILRILIILHRISINELINKINTLRLIMGQDPVLSETVIEAVDFLIRKGLVKIETVHGVDWAGRVIGSSIISLTRQDIIYEVLADDRFAVIKKHIC